MRLIDADALMQAMYHRAFETDGDTMWQSGCWVRYRAIEEVVKAQPTVEAEPEWIPIKMHPATDEEQESRPDIDYWFDCLMPNDEEEILVTVKDSKGRRWVEKDVCYVEDSYGLDSGYDWFDDVAAWCKLPKPYKEGQG